LNRGESTFDFARRLWKIAPRSTVNRSEAMPDSERPATSIKLPLALTFFGLLLLAGLAAMPLLAGPPDPDAMPDTVRFLGHFHPLLLHLPIGVFALILVQELGAIFFGKKGAGRQPSLFPMFFGVMSAILAVMAGFLLYQGGDYAGETIERHLWGGLAFAGMAVVTFVVQAWSVALAANLAFYRLLLFLSVGVMGFTSHDGASITHGSDYLLRYAPDPIREFFNAPPRGGAGNRLAGGSAGETLSPEELVVYTDIVAPIITSRCVDCHKESRSRGRLRMDTYEMLLKGGREGPALVAGSSAESNMIVRIELPLDDEDHMPPIDPPSPQVEPYELVVLKWWIDSGADPEKKLGDFEVPGEVGVALAELFAAGPVEPVLEGDYGAEPASEGPDESFRGLVAEIAGEFPGALTFESRDSPLVTFTAVSMRESMDDDQFAKLAPVLPNLASLDLNATRITDRSVALLAEARNLRLVRLAETAISDAALETLATLESLESVNLYGTGVTDEGVMKLGPLPNLRQLYLWQTDVSEETINALREKMPNCEIVTGI
jgi:uncharacterized membrane protein